MNLIQKILSPLSLVAAIGYSSLVGCEKPQNVQDPNDPYEAAARESKAGLEKARKDIEAKRARESQPITPTTASSVTQPGTTIVPTIPTTVVQPNLPTTTQPSVPTTPTTSGPSGPTVPTPVPPVTPTQPNVPNVTDGSERKTRPGSLRKAFRNNVSKHSERQGFNYFSVTDPQNFIGAVGYGRLQNPKLSDLSLDGYGAGLIVNLDVKPFSWLRTEVSGSYAEEFAKRTGKDLISNIGLARIGSEIILFDNKTAYLSVGPTLGVNSVVSPDAVGFEPSELTAGLIGGKARLSLKELGLEAYISGLQSFAGKHASKEIDAEFDYSVRELKAGFKQHLGKGVSVGIEGSEVFQETEDVTRFWVRSGSCYVELKDLVKGLNAWGIVTGRDIDAPGKQRAHELEGRIRFLADLGYGIHFGVGGAYSFSKVQGTKGSNNYSLDALIALGF